MDDIDTDEWVRELWRPESLDSYTPFEAATRMVGILEKILRFPESGKPWRIERWEMELFPHSFRENLFEYSDAIIKAMDRNELRYVCYGEPADTKKIIAPELRRIPHDELRKLVSCKYPDLVKEPRMAWLFDTRKRSTQPAVSSVPLAEPDTESRAKIASEFGRAGGKAKHAESNAKKEKAIAFFLENRHRYQSKNEAATDLAEKFILSFTTARNYLKGL